MMPDALGIHKQNENKPMKEMPPSGRKGRLPLFIVALIPTCAVGLAWFLYFYGSEFLPQEGTNKGELITPPVSFHAMKLHSEHGVFYTEQLEGKWGILIFGDDRCAGELCQETMYQTRQAHIALGRESHRVVRVFIAPDKIDVPQVVKEQHPGLLWFGSDTSSILNTLNRKEWPENHYFIVDPLGNIMMHYQAGQYGKDILTDLQKLLKASSIG